MQIRNELYHSLQSLNKSLNNILTVACLSPTDSKLERFLYTLEKQRFEICEQVRFSNDITEGNEIHFIDNDYKATCATLLIQNKVPVKDIQIWLGHSNIQTTMIYTHLDETNKEVSAQVLMAKFQFILTNYNENEIYEMKNEALNNIYENIDNSSQFKDIEKVVATTQF